MKKTAGVAELKEHLSEYLQQVKAGQELLITDRGTPVAKLVPLGGSAARESREERLAREGLLILGRGRFGKALLTPPVGDPSVGAAVLAALIEDRREGR